MRVEIKFYIILMVICINSLYINANTSKVDSLTNLILNSDTINKAEVYNKLAMEYIRSIPDSADYFSNLSIKEAKVNNDFENEAKAYYQLGLTKYFTQNYDSAIFQFNNSQALWVQLNNNEQIALLYKLTGICYSYKGDNLQALKYFNKSLQINLERNNESELAMIYGNIGMANRNLSNYQEAIESFIKALSYFDKTGDKNSQANTYNHLGNIFRDWENNDKALEYYKKALTISEEVNYTTLTAGILNNMGIIYRKKGEFEKAVDYQTRSLFIKEKMENISGMAASFLGLGITYKQMGNFTSALTYYQKAKEIHKEVGDKSGEGADLGNIGLMYIALKKPIQAIKYLELSNQIADSIQYTELLKNNAKGLSDAYELLKDYQKALYYSNLHHQLQDSIFTSEKHNQIEDIETKYATEKKEQEIAMLQVQNELIESKNAQQEKSIQFKNLLLYGLAFFLILIVIGILAILGQLRQKNIAYKNLVKKNVELIECQNPDKKIRLQSKLTDKMVSDLITDLEKYFTNEKPFLLSDFQLNDCAKYLNTNSKYLSQVINDVYNINFNNFLNNYRISEACILLSGNDAKKYTIEAIAGKVGFHSKSAFNTSFKKVTGVTPSFYQINISQSEPFTSHKYI